MRDGKENEIKTYFVHGPFFFTSANRFLKILNADTDPEACFSARAVGWMDRDGWMDRGCLTFWNVLGERNSKRTQSRMNMHKKTNQNMNSRVFFLLGLHDLADSSRKLL